MTTSVFTQFDLIQYFAALDPYSYSVDNRPLEDIKQNIDVLASAHDASLNAAKLAAVATGMVIRGIVGDNMMVGKKSIGSYNLVIDHGVFVKAGAVYGSDPNSIPFPKMGLQQQGVTFTCPPPGSPGQIRYYTISADFDAPDNTLSFYDTANINTPNSVELGTVTYAPLSAITINSPVFDSSYFPATPLGYHALFHVAVPSGVVSLNSDMITNINFVDDLSRAYDSYSTISTGPDTITDITVNAYYSLVFVNGVFQSSANYTVNSPEQITWNTDLPSGLTIDFVVLRGGGSGGGGGGSGAYAYQTASFTTVLPAENTFNVVPPLDSDYVFVFVNGVFQADINRGTPGQIVLPATVPPGTVVDLVQTIGGSSLPLGGSSGQSVHKSGAGPIDVWQSEVLSVNVSSASGSGPLAYISSAIGFNEAYDLYEGRQIVLLNTGGFTTVPANATNGAVTPSVTLQIGGLGALPVTRPSNLPLKNNDIYSEAVVVYKTVPTAHFELVAPGMPDVVSALTVLGDQNDIEVTPLFPMMRVQDGTILSIRPLNVLPSGNDLEVCSLKVNFVTGSLQRPIGKMNGTAVVGLKDGDIQGTTNHLFQYNFSLDYFILLNPATLPVLEVSGAKRQTVLMGPSSLSRSYEHVNVIGLTRDTIPLTGMRPTLIDIGVGQNLEVNAGVLASFANGFSSKGPEDFVEELPSGVVADLATVSRGWNSSTITGITLDVASSWLTLVYSTNVNAGLNPVSVGNWVRIREMEGTGIIPLIGLNGIFYVEAATGNNLQVSCLGSIGDVFTTLDGILNTVVDRVYFVYADRDDDGAITYGLSEYPPVYARSSVEDFSSPVALSHLYVGQCIFDIDKMKMYEIQGGGVLIEVRRLFLGEVYVPDALTPVTNDFVVGYEYNGKYSAYLEGTGPNGFYPYPNTPGTYISFNDLRHGMGTCMYDSKITSLVQASSAGRVVGALQAGTKFYPQQSSTTVEVLTGRKDSTQLCFVLPATVPTVIDLSGRSNSYSGSLTPIISNYLIELERSF